MELVWIILDEPATYPDPQALLADVALLLEIHQRDLEVMTGFLDPSHCSLQHEVCDVNYQTYYKNVYTNHNLNMNKILPGAC